MLSYFNICFYNKLALIVETLLKTLKNFQEGGNLPFYRTFYLMVHTNAFL